MGEVATKRTFGDLEVEEPFSLYCQHRPAEQFVKVKVRAAAVKRLDLLLGHSTDFWVQAFKSPVLAPTPTIDETEQPTVRLILVGRYPVLQCFDGGWTDARPAKVLSITSALTIHDILTLKTLNHLLNFELESVIVARVERPRWLSLPRENAMALRVSGEDFQHNFLPIQGLFLSPRAQALPLGRHGIGDCVDASVKYLPRALDLPPVNVLHSLVDAA